jgi:hypothetical protein
LNNGRPGFKIIDAFFLTIPTGTETSLEFLDSAVRKTLALEGPSGRKNVHVICARD